jgi:hypothetical protein
MRDPADGSGYALAVVRVAKLHENRRRAEREADRNRIDRLHELAGKLDRLMEEHEQLFRDVRERAEHLAEGELIGGPEPGKDPRKAGPGAGQ